MNIKWRAVYAAAFAATFGAAAWVGLSLYATSGRAQQQIQKAVTQAPRIQYAVISNLTVTEANGKTLATAWIRYLSAAGADAVGVNASANLEADLPKDDPAVRRWVAKTNQEESVSLGVANLETPGISSDLQAQVYRDALAKAIAKLGAEGYEMISPDPHTDQIFGVLPRLARTTSHVGGAISKPYLLYFKRVG